ncbi:MULTISPECIES: hypothetical protein [Clostridium]|uniref:Uncharacterized protein n=1 Tax=Clostridium aquiflavi TaxID=3073603 RepID=A0ABU1EKG6_9CLOT|nr:MULTISPECIES: hypothetical protein [unclassified Clostridium]MDR5588885.1 hypothetical protein [Clostridium sp. 5N-1]NFG61336.1 hypothetical protein [Clostridium botulinum]NFQ09193.1 hypothetical protein [Clostridium botulinum]
MGDIKQWSFGFNELKYFLFKRKICNICGTKMKKVTSKKYIGMKKFNGIITGPSCDKAYEVTVFYYCTKCNKKYSLEELAKWNK